MVVALGAREKLKGSLDVDLQGTYIYSIGARIEGWEGPDCSWDLLISNRNACFISWLSRLACLKTMEKQSVMAEASRVALDVVQTNGLYGILSTVESN